jgi:hypothetical protein
MEGSQQAVHSTRTGQTMCGRTQNASCTMSMKFELGLVLVIRGHWRSSALHAHAMDT